jgi:tRNA dimethylallyltransferase
MDAGALAWRDGAAMIPLCIAGPTAALCIAGPTAAGKSALAMTIAEHWPVEIVNVDSAQVYRGMDIGTAKPSVADRTSVPHHLIDIRDPDAPYSAALFVADAQRVCAEISARGKHPLLVGGTMLYFKALAGGLDEMPAADATIRAEIEAQAAAQGWPALHDELARVDAATAARLAPNDAQRIGRALEVWRVSGRALSSFHTQRKVGAAPPLIALEPDDRAWLHTRIAARFDAMLEAGFLGEVQRLRERPGVHAELPAMRAVGYRQALQALDAGFVGDALRNDVRERGIAATRQLAKRQLTWLRGMPHRRRVACDAASAIDQSLRFVGELWKAA